MSDRQDAINAIPVDPLTAGPASPHRVYPDRVFYATGVLLDAEDFRAEQLYHRSRLARSLAYLHGSGTVAGLKVVWEAAVDPTPDPDPTPGQEEQLVVEPGLALDRLGRLIEIPRRACIRLNRWFDAQSDDDLVQGWHGDPFNGVVADVFLCFVTCERGKTPAFAAGPFDALDAVQPSRLREGYELSLVIRPEADPPLPQPTGADLAEIADLGDRRTALHNEILAAWRESTEQWDENGPVPLAEHVTGQNPTAVFLARVTIPATNDGSRPARIADATVSIDNTRRAFVYTPGALARWLGV